MPMDMPKMEVMKDWIMKNLHLNSDAQGNEKYPDGIFCVYPSGVALGRELPDGNSEMKTFVTYEMLRGKQIEKGENQSRAAKVQEEEGLNGTSNGTSKGGTEKPAENQRVSFLVSGERGIRTPGASQHGSFQDYCNRPLYHLSRG